LSRKQNVKQVLVREGKGRVSRRVMSYLQRTYGGGGK